MSRVKIRLADNIARVVYIEEGATNGATLGTNLRTPDGVVGTPATVRTWLGLGDASGTLVHSSLSGLSKDDHPQYTMWAARETVKGQWDFTKPIWGSNGTAALPAYTFFSDQNTGVYRLGADNFGFSTNGVARWDISTTLVNQSIPLRVYNNSGILIRNEGVTPGTGGIELTSINGFDSTVECGNQLAFWEFKNTFGFRFRHEGDTNLTGDFRIYRHDNDATGVFVMGFARSSSQVWFADGSNSSPVLTFEADINTGFYRPASDNIGVSTGGTLRWTFGTAAHISTLPIRALFGTDSAPSFSFDGDTDTGMYRFGANQIGWSCNNTNVLILTNTALTAGVVISGISGNAGGPSFGFSGDPNTGMYSGGTDILAFSTGGNERLRIAASGQLGLGGANYGTAGQIITSNGSGSAPTWQDPPGASLQTFITEDDETATLVNSRRMVAGSNISFDVTVAGEFEINATGGSGGGIEPDLKWEEYTDLVGYSGVDGFVTAASVGGTVTYTGAAGHPGIVNITTGATAATSNGLLKAAAPLTGAAQIFVGGGEIIFDTLIRINSLWPASNTGQIRAGLMDEITGAPSNGVHMQYDDSVNVWRLFCRAGGTASSVNGGTVVTTGWHHIRIVVNSAGTSTELFVDGVSQGTVTTNIPSAGVSYGAQVQKATGTTAMTIDVDLFHIKQTFSSARW